MAKQFFYGCLGILALTISYHLGTIETAEAGGGAYEPQYAHSWYVTEEGDLYYAPSDANVADPSIYPWTYGGNIFSGATATEKASWGDIKREFK